MFSTKLRKLKDVPIFFHNSSLTVIVRLFLRTRITLRVFGEGTDPTCVEFLKELKVKSSQFLLWDIYTRTPSDLFVSLGNQKNLINPTSTSGTSCRVIIDVRNYIPH